MGDIMKISAKGRYGLAAATDMAQRYSQDEYITVLSVAERLGISKIYLEQVFSLLKRGGLVFSTKGSQGGYQLSKNPNLITAYDILYAVETSLFEKSQEDLLKNANDIEKSLEHMVFSEVDLALARSLKKVTLSDLATEAERQNGEHGNMFYI